VATKTNKASSARSARLANSMPASSLPPTSPIPPSPPPSAPRPSSPQPILGWSNANATNVWMPVDSYLVRHYGWQTSDVSGCQASIICYQLGVIVGYVNFYHADHVPLSAINAFSPPQLVLTINLAVERVLEVMETLRLERPIHIGVDLTQRIGWVGTSPENVGHVSS